MKNDDNRQSNFDCLRLVCMVMVVSMHYFGWGGLNSSTETSRMNFVLASGIGVYCRVAVNCFYMITGYFIVPCSQDIDFRRASKKVLAQYSKLWVYSVLLFVGCCATGIAEFSWDELVQSFFPIMTNQWWFMTIFMALLCIKPFIGKLRSLLNDKELIALLGIIAFFDTLQAIVGRNAFREQGTGIMHAVFMLLLGYGVKKLPVLQLRKWCSAVLYFGICLIAGVFALVGRKFFQMDDAVVLYYNSPFIVIAAIGFFNLFRTWNCSFTWTTRIAPYVLAIYLINDHRLMEKNFYEKVLHCSNYYESGMMILHWAVSVLLFVAGGLLIDFTLEKMKSYLMKVFLR